MLNDIKNPAHMIENNRKPAIPPIICPMSFAILSSTKSTTQVINNLYKYGFFDTLRKNQTTQINFTTAGLFQGVFFYIHS